jgi:hypothetical protein
MLVNPYVDKRLIVPYIGTRLLQETFGLVGARIQDTIRPQRMWMLQAFYAPVQRALGGVRAKLIDQKGFITFVNQRDLEILLGIAEPGSICPWSQKRYVAPDDRAWCGFCADEEDLRDDLHDRELFLRVNSLTGILDNAEITRRLHLDDNHDVEELYILMWDADPETGLTPDLRIETVERRWKRVERRRVQWEQA